LNWLTTSQVKEEKGEEREEEREEGE